MKRGTNLRPQSTGERGSALVVVLFSLLVTTLIGLSMTFNSMVEVRISRNYETSTEAFYIAEAGLNHALQLIENYNLDLAAAVRGLDGQVGTSDDGLLVLAAIPLAQRIPAAGLAFGEGSYTALLTDNSGGAGTEFLLTADGLGPNNSRARVEATFRVSTSHGLLVGGKLRISGNPLFQGNGGTVHSNGTLDFDGTPCAHGHFSSAAGIVDPDKAKTGTGCTTPGDVRVVGPVTIPTVLPVTLKPQANYILGNDGKIRNQAGTDVTSSVPGWSWDGGNLRWTASDTIPAGTYYADGNIGVSGNPGSSSTPISLTLIAAGWIEISGSPITTPALTSGGITYSVVAGTDLKINGNPTITQAGLHYAGHQIDFSGNAVLRGQVIAADLADTGTPQNMVVRQSDGYMVISGNPTVIHDGGSGFGSGRQKVGWREIRL